MVQDFQRLAMGRLTEKFKYILWAYHRQWGHQILYFACTTPQELDFMSQAPGTGAILYVFRILQQECEPLEAAHVDRCI